MAATPSARADPVSPPRRWPCSTAPSPSPSCSPAPVASARIASSGDADVIVRRTARLPGLLLALIGAAPAMAQHGPPPPRPDIKPGQPTAWTRLLIEAIETAHG